MAQSSEPRACLVEQILDRFVQACSAIFTGERESWLALELTMPQFKVLMLVVSRHRATISQIARLLEAGLPSVTRLIDRLEEQGLIERESDPADRRVTYILPTEAGTGVVEKLISYRREVLTSCLETLEGDELEAVGRGMQLLLEGARRAGRIDTGCDTESAAGVA
jgi:DNA-binding MarR family transcriptional regulator